jgi:hypothetical protein
MTSSGIVIYAPRRHRQDPEEEALVDLLEVLAYDPVLLGCLIEDANAHWNTRQHHKPAESYLAELKELERMARKAGI